MERRLPDRLKRTLGPSNVPSRTIKSALLLIVFVGLIAAAVNFGRTPDLSHVHVTMLSGSEQGNYHAIVAKAAAEAKRRKGHITNLASAGSIENIARLDAAKRECSIEFALVQDGLPWPTGHAFHLIGRLPVSESLVVLGRDADRIASVADLRGMRVGLSARGITVEVAMAHLLKDAGLSLDDVVKCNVYLTDMANFGAMNATYEQRFSKPYPARTTIGVKQLPKDAMVEIEMIARRS